MKLFEGVKIVNGIGFDPMDRITISSGMEPALTPVDEFDYEPNAFRFKKPWRKPTAAELDVLLANDNQPLPYSESICLRKMPDDLTRKFQAIGIPNLEKERKYLELKKEKPLELLQLMDEFYEFEKTLALKLDVFHKLKMTFHRWTWPTVAMDIYDSKKMVGMHFDEWDGLPLNKLNEATNRINFNIGLEPRYLVFINLTAKAMFDLTKDFHDIDFSTNGQVKLAATFFEQFTDYPVVRVKVLPYEAYIAPTENVIHDGSTEEKNEPDISLTTRGFFSTDAVLATHDR